MVARAAVLQRRLRWRRGRTGNPTPARPLHRERRL